MMLTMPLDLSELIGASESPPDDEPKILPEAAVMRLREAKALYGVARFECPFKPGDLVTPRSWAPMTGVGDPHIVVETRVAAGPIFSAGDPGSARYGPIDDIRVLTIMRDDVVPFWGESWMYEPYTPPDDAQG